MLLRFLGILLLLQTSLSAEPLLIADKVIVKKSTRMLYLSSGGEIYKKYHVSLGQVPVGAKEMRGT